MSDSSNEPSLVSVIMPAFNAAGTIGAAISSVINQDWPAVELIIIDDGSSDGTLAIAQAYEKTSTDRRRVVVLTQGNAGPSTARNRGIEQSQGELIALCDADDQLMPNYLSIMVKFLSQHPQRTIVVSDAYLLTPTGITPGRHLLRERIPSPSAQRLAMLQNNIGCIFSIFPRALITEVGDFEPTLRSCEDWDLWCRAVFAGWVIAKAPGCNALYRWVGDSLSSDTHTMQSAEDTVLERARAGLQLTGREQEFITKRLSVGSPFALASASEDSLRRGDFAAARRELVAAAQLLPTQRRVVIKSRIARVPGGTRLLGRRQQRVDRMVGYSEKMRR